MTHERSVRANQPRPRRAKKEVLHVIRLSAEERRELAATNPGLAETDVALLIWGPSSVLSVIQDFIRSAPEWDVEDAPSE